MVSGEGYIVEAIPDAIERDAQAYGAGTQRRERQLRAPQTNRHFGGNVPAQFDSSGNTLILDGHREGHFGALLTNDSHPQPYGDAEGKGFCAQTIGEPAPGPASAGWSIEHLWGRFLQLLLEADGIAEEIEFSLACQRHGPPFFGNQ